VYCSGLFKHSRNGLKFYPTHGCIHIFVYRVLLQTVLWVHSPSFQNSVKAEDNLSETGYENVKWIDLTHNKC